MQNVTVLEVVQPKGTALKDGLSVYTWSTTTTDLYDVHTAHLSLSSDEITALLNDLMQLRSADFIFRLEETTIVG